MAVSLLIATLFPEYVESADDRAIDLAEAEDAADFGFEDGMDEEGL